MLPDLPSLKDDIQVLITRYLRKAIRARLGVFSDVGRQTVHEGAGTRIVRADSSIEDSSLKEASGEIEMKLNEFSDLTHEGLIKKLDQIAEDMAGQMQKHLFGSLNETLDRTGQTVDAKGKPFSAEMMFEVLEKIQVDFDEYGQAKELQLVVGPDMVPRIRELQEQEKRDPSIKRRHDEIMQRKWMQWRDREASRKLVG